MALVQLSQRENTLVRNETTAVAPINTANAIGTVFPMSAPEKSNSPVAVSAAIPPSTLVISQRSAIRSCSAKEGIHGVWQRQIWAVCGWFVTVG